MNVTYVYVPPRMLSVAVAVTVPMALDAVHM